jgi:hypothetical protein
MQQTSVYLYRNVITGYLNAEDPPTERFRKVYNRNLKVYRSTDNRIDIQVKNYDQKGANLNSTAIVFNLIINDSDQLVLSKDCVIRDPANGRIFVTLTSAELKNLNEGLYKYSVVQEYRDDVDSESYVVTRKEPLYIDSQYGVIGFLDIRGDVLGSFVQSTVVDKFSYTNPSALGEPETQFFISSIIDANPFETTPQRIHTFQFYYSDEFNGTVTVEASFEEQGGTPYKWVTVAESTDRPRFINVTGKYNWFRIKYEPAELVLEDEEAVNSLEKVIYR